jgi:hypothetical protein
VVDLLGGDDHHRQVEQRQRERRPHQRRLPPHHVESHRAIHPAAEELDEEAETE